MPELPEVETLVRDLSKSIIIGKTITSIDVFSPKIILGDRLQFKRALIGKKLLSIQRRGKYLIFSFSEGRKLTVHLRMTGHLILIPLQSSLTRHDHVRFIFEDEVQLVYRDTRKFGRMSADEDERLRKLGPEPLECSLGDFFEIIANSKKRLKALLLDQNEIAGIGNIYADEILWKGSLHPTRKSFSLNKLEAERLFRSMRSILKSAILNRGTSLGLTQNNFYSAERDFGKNQHHLNAYGRKGLPCKRCGSKIMKGKIGQRSTFFCPQCQKEN